MRASSALLHKKQSSTCKKHACGCFLLVPWICSAYFQKGWFKPATDGGGFSFTMFWALLKTRSQRLFTDVQSLTVDKDRILVPAVMFCHIVLPHCLGFERCSKPKLKLGDGCSSFIHYSINRQVLKYGDRCRYLACQHFAKLIDFIRQNTHYPSNHSPYFFHTAAVQLNVLLREKILCHKHAFYILRISRYHFKQR